MTKKRMATNTQVTKITSFSLICSRWSQTSKHIALLCTLSVSLYSCYQLNGFHGCKVKGRAFKHLLLSLQKELFVFFRGELSKLQSLLSLLTLGNGPQSPDEPEMDHSFLLFDSLMAFHIPSYFISRDFSSPVVLSGPRDMWQCLKPEGFLFFNCLDWEERMTGIQRVEAKYGAKFSKSTGQLPPPTEMICLQMSIILRLRNSVAHNTAGGGEWGSWKMKQDLKACYFASQRS